MDRAGGAGAAALAVSAGAWAHAVEDTKVTIRQNEIVLSIANVLVMNKKKWVGNGLNRCLPVDIH